MTFTLSILPTPILILKYWKSLYTVNVKTTTRTTYHFIDYRAFNAPQTFSEDEAHRSKIEKRLINPDIEYSTVLRLRLSSCGLPPNTRILLLN